MSHTENAIVATSKLIAIANAIRTKTGESAEMTLDEMATEIGNISTSSSAVLEALSVTSNGTYTPGTGVDGFNSVTVNVSGAQALSGTFTGDGTSNTVDISCGFVPDVVIIVGNLTTDASLVGPMLIGIARDLCAVSIYDTSSSSTTVKTSYSNFSIQDLNDATYGTRESYATYSNGVLTVTNNTGSNAWGYFASGVTYNYVLVKYT